MSIKDAAGWANNWIAVVDDEILRMRRGGNHDIALALQAGQKHIRTLIVSAQQAEAQMPDAREVTTEEWDGMSETARGFICGWNRCREQMLAAKAKEGDR